MSAVAAILAKGGRSASGARLDAMLAAMASRAPDGCEGRLNGPAALGHRLLAVAKNGMAALPSGPIVTLDGRFDRRDALSGQLNLPTSANDADLLLGAYQRWGLDGIDRIDGDFAFVLWDPAQRRLVAARDRLGVRPLYYTNLADALLIASHPAALLAVEPALAEDIDDAAMRAYCAGEAMPLDRTIHAGIRRLPPAHVLIAGEGRLHIRRYFDWPTEPRRRADPPEAFAMLLEQAVGERLPADHSGAALLSGGLDSSSIVALGARARRREGCEPLRTYSQVFPGARAGDERLWIDAVVNEAGALATYVPSSKVSAFGGFDAVLDAQCSPFIAPNIAVTRHTLSQVSREGVRVLLDGHGGDEVVWHGVPGLYDLAFSGKIARLWSQLRPLAKAERQSALRLFVAVLARKGPHRRWLPAPTVALADPKPAWLVHAPDLPALDAVVPGREAIGGHIEALTGGYFVQSLEVLDKLAGDLGLEVRFPFLDRQLVEWCVTATPDERLGEGSTRALLRRGMRGIIPEMVRIRRDKYDFLAQLVDAMIDRDQETVASVLYEPDERLAAYFELRELRRLWTRLNDDRNSVRGRDVQALWRAVMIGLWLRRGGASAFAATEHQPARLHEAVGSA